MAKTARSASPRAELAARYLTVRALSDAIAAPLSDADATIQPMPDASPAKWHLAHTSWFFETFVLRDHSAGYRIYDERWPFLFNSYYEAEGERHARPRRGMLSRPSLKEVYGYRRHVDEAVLSALPDLPEQAIAILELGLNHEQQHQELMLMDLKATFFENPLLPALWQPQNGETSNAASPISWIERPAGIAEIGYGGGGFAFDCERPRHRQLLHPHALADRLVTNGEWIDFIEGRAYERPDLWLSDGWAWVSEQDIRAPLYWREVNGKRLRFGLDGLRPVDPAEPVCHISYYEADAFARWAGARLPTEAEWESAASGLDARSGSQLDAAGPAHPRPAEPGPGLRQMFGETWQWTMSAFLPHPRFRPEEGAIGEYNAKFMSGQFVLKGASCATPRGHSRASYRNFFYPHQRWMFSGLRLAKDL